VKGLSNLDIAGSLRNLFR